ncbi:MAG: metallophosphatase family protein [Clostridiales bacterium]|nr:metallophosphatase family protein [Clostridiales bacterium]
MEEHKIAIISDTHGILRDAVKEYIRECEYIFHAGDIGSPNILAELNRFAETYAVRGNADGNWDETLPESIDIELFGFGFYVIHNKKQIKKDLSGIDFVICGHSHKFEITETDGTVFLNSGGCGRKRFNLPLTIMILTLFPQSRTYKTERVDLEKAPQKVLKQGEIKKLDRLIDKTVKFIEKGKSAEEAAVSLKADPNLIEQIYRIYLTHQSINREGILKRLELKDL